MKLAQVAAQLSTVREHCRTAADYAAGRSGCDWFIVEQDIRPGDPFESLKISFDHLKTHLVTD